MSRFDKVTGEWTIYQQADFLADNDVRAITRDNNGNLWIATVAGISVYSPQTRSWEVVSKEDGLPTPYVTSICISGQSSVEKTGQLKDVKSDASLTDNRKPKTENYSRIWIGSDRGLGTRKYMGNEWTFHTPREGFSVLGSRSSVKSPLVTDNRKPTTDDHSPR